MKQQQQQQQRRRTLWAAKGATHLMPTVFVLHCRQVEQANVSSVGAQASCVEPVSSGAVCFKPTASSGQKRERERMWAQLHSMSGSHFANRTVAWRWTCKLCVWVCVLKLCVNLCKLKVVVVLREIIFYICSSRAKGVIFVVVVVFYAFFSSVEFALKKPTSCERERKCNCRRTFHCCCWCIDACAPFAVHYARKGWQTV